jgi:uncharacterized DUF497 family protein
MIETEFEWDEEKNRTNIEKHSISFDFARLIFLSPHLCKLDDRCDYGETRWQAIGSVSDIILHVTYTERGTRIRLISARKASKKERSAFDEYCNS